MKSINKPFVFAAFLVVTLALPSSFSSADGGRFFIKSTSSFWKNTIGSRNEFKDGFTADLSDLQYGLLKLFRVEVEAVPVLHVLPDDGAILTPDSTEASVTPSPSPARTPKVKTIKNRKGVVTRYLPSDQTPWGIEMIYNNNTIAATSGGDGVNVAILDTGITATHPDLKNRIGDCKDFTNFRFAVVDGQCDDKNGHGTHVAGIIAADGGSDHLGIYGVAPTAKLMAYRVCDANGSCYADDIATGLRTAANNGAQVINMSFGTDDAIPLITDAINYAADHGVLMVAAAGNDGPAIDSIDFPGAYGSVIGVGAINQASLVTSWSSRGNNLNTTIGTIEDHDIEFAAPGDNIESTWKSGSYAVLSGTSMASPFVAGLAAKYWRVNDPHPAQATREYLHSLAHDLAPANEDNDSGLGLPQVK